MLRTRMLTWDLGPTCLFGIDTGRSKSEVGDAGLGTGRSPCGQLVLSAAGSVPAGVLAQRPALSPSSQLSVPEASCPGRCDLVKDGPMAGQSFLGGDRAPLPAHQGPSLCLQRAEQRVRVQPGRPYFS